jgi:hypothetical protein
MVTCSKCKTKLKLRELKNVNLDSHEIFCNSCMINENKENERKTLALEKKQKEQARNANIKAEQKERKILSLNAVWEYHTETFILKIGGFPRRNMDNVMNNLGKKGWELVDVSPIAMPVVFTKVPVTKQIIAVFKRKHT